MRLRSSRRAARAEGQGGAAGCLPADLGASDDRRRRTPARRTHGRPNAAAASCSATPSTTSPASARATCSRCSDRRASGRHGSCRSSCASLDDVAVVHGRCLSYGEGITYWPVVEVVKQARRTRGRSPTGPRAMRSRSCSARPTSRGRNAGSDRLGVSQVARGQGRRGAAHLPVRRHPVGRGGLPRARRARRGSLARCADTAPLHGSPGAARQATELGEAAS